MNSLSNHPAFKKIISVLMWIIFVTPFGIYGLNIYRYMINIPYWDDFGTVLDFTNRFTQVQTLNERIALLFSQHNEHRPIFERFVYLSYYYLFHQVNFKFYIVFGNLGLILTTLMLFFYFRRHLDLSLVQLLPLPYLLLSLLQWENMFFTSAGVENYWFMFFSVAFLICLSMNRPLLYCVLFPLALFTSGGGIVLYPLGILFLVLREKWKSLPWFIAISTFFLVSYFYGYIKPAGSPNIFEAFLHPINAISYFFSFLGNILPANFIGIPIGLIFFILSAFVIKQNGESLLQLGVGFVALTALLSTITRSGFGVWQAGSSRYSLYPLFGILCLYIFLIMAIPKVGKLNKIVVTGATICALAYLGTLVGFYEHNQFFQIIKNERVASIVGFSHGDNQSLLFPTPDLAAHILLTSEQLQIYNYKDQLP